MPDKTVAQKLLIKPGYQVLLVNAPQNYPQLLGEVPAGVSLLDRVGEPADLIQFFVHSRQELETQLPQLKMVLKPAGLLWVTYHKGTSKIKTDVNRDTIAAYAQTLGLQAVAMIAIDDDWAALRVKLI